MSLWQNHAIFETNSIILLDRHADRDRDRRPRRDRAAVLSEEHDREGRRHAALYAARARRPQHLRPRGLLSLPFADDPAAARRGRALRPLFARRREHVRPAVPVGIEAHRARSRARRRQIFRRLAPRPSAAIRARSCRPRSCRAIRCWPRPRSTTAHIGDDLKVQATLGVPYTRGDDRQRASPTCARRRPPTPRRRRSGQALSEGAGARLRRQSATG